MRHDSVFNKLHYVPSGAKPVSVERYNRVAALCAGTKMRAGRAAEKTGRNEIEAHRYRL
jgi:hypothetical protein